MQLTPRNECVKTLTNKTVSIVTLLSIPITAGLFLLAKPITLLFSGNEYIPAIIPMQVMTPIVFIISIASITGPRILAAMYKEKITLYYFFSKNFTYKIYTFFLL